MAALKKKKLRPTADRNASGREMETIKTASELKDGLRIFGKSGLSVSTVAGSIPEAELVSNYYR